MESQSRVFFVLAVLGLVSLLATVGYLLFEISSFYSSSDATRLETLWTRDLQRLREAKVLPKGFEDIQSIELTAATELTRKWQKHLHIPIKTSPAGHYRLEILLLSWDEGNTLAAIVQYNLIDLRSKDMVWELGRTFILKGNRSSEETLAHQLQGLFQKK
jgi:hypothetical protein